MPEADTLGGSSPLAHDAHATRTRVLLALASRARTHT
jgi:hypothetical protein